MITINGIEFNDTYSWINEEIPIDQKVAKGVVFLVPVYNAENRLGIWMKMVERLNPRPQKVIFCENDSVDKTVKIIKKWKYPHQLIKLTIDKEIKSKVKDEMKSRGKTFQIIALVRQTLFLIARKLNARYAIFMDDDIIPSYPNVIEQLISNNKDIVGGVYIKKYNGITPVIVAFWNVDAPKENMPQIDDLDDAIKSCKEHDFHFIGFGKCGHQLYETTFIGGGLMCLSNKIISDEKIMFHPIFGGGGEDAGFCILAGTFGYKTFLDGKVRCSHMDFSKKRFWGQNK